MKDFNVTFKVRNNKLLSLMRMFGYETAAELSRAAGVAQVDIGLYLNLKKPPITKRGQYAAAVKKLANFFKVLEEDLFPNGFLDVALEKNQVEREYDCSEVEFFLEDRNDYNPETLLEDSETESRLKQEISNALLRLAPREQRVISLRMGFNGNQPQSLKAIADGLGVTVERVRQMEAKALRKLKHPRRSSRLKEFI